MDNGIKERNEYRAESMGERKRVEMCWNACKERLDSCTTLQ